MKLKNFYLFIYVNGGGAFKLGIFISTKLSKSLAGVVVLI